MEKQVILNSIQEIIKRLETLQISVELLAAYTNTVNLFSIDELNSLNIPISEKMDYLYMVQDGEKLHMLTTAVAINTSEELANICYSQLDELKSMIKDVM
mgnify:CR=1 FL=1